MYLPYTVALTGLKVIIISFVTKLSPLRGFGEIPEYTLSNIKIIIQESEAHRADILVTNQTLKTSLVGGDSIQTKSINFYFYICQVLEIKW
jgi:hypothetical protein